MTQVVGIDLGTSNCALAFADTELGGSEVHQLAIGQWVEGRRIERLPLLPSALYYPRKDELDEAVAEGWVSGAYARQRGRETLGRSVFSAKSWLCNSNVDRLAALLPVQCDELLQDRRLSPVVASQRLLEHLRAELVSQHPHLDLQNATVVLTVPASFDPAARELTVRAATLAGLTVRLLEEPQAAFQDYWVRNPELVRQLLVEEPRATVLVCDIGGGTLDFSLIEVSELEGEVIANRRAVGQHLLLGGDNMDLAIAQFVAPILSAASLDERQMGQLVSECRRAKEVLLGAEPPEFEKVRLLSRGATLLGGSLTMDLSRQDVERIVLDGFFPSVSARAKPSRGRLGLLRGSLPYERDPAVTRHLAEFLQQHRKGQRLSAVLFNGGVAQSPAVAGRIVACLNQWMDRPVTWLRGAEAELAVSRGATLHGLSLAGLGGRVEGGAARALYVGLGSSDGHPEESAVCVIPRGGKESVRYVAEGRVFELTVGAPARFELFYSNTANHSPGEVVSVQQGGLSTLSTLSTAVEMPGASAHARVPVTLEGETTEVGTLELACVPVNRNLGRRDRHLLEFELRPRQGRLSRQASFGAEASAVLPELAASAALEIQRVFGRKKNVSASPRAAKDLLRTLEKQLGPRKDWGVGVARPIVDLLLVSPWTRMRSEDHERTYWSLMGFCLRPGFGCPGDGARMDALWPLFEEFVRYSKSERAWLQFWVAWRRITGGLSAGRQEHIWKAVAGHLAPPEEKWKRTKGFKPLAVEELRQLCAQLERIPEADRVRLGNWTLELTWHRRDPRLWQCLGSIGARVPAYQSPEHAVNAKTTGRWVEDLLLEKWNEVPTAARAALNLARVTSVEEANLPVTIRERVAAALSKAGVPPEWGQAVMSYVPMSAQSRSEQQGESLPLGLSLAGDSRWPVSGS